MARVCCPERRRQSLWVSRIECAGKSRCVFQPSSINRVQLLVDVLVIDYDIVPGIIAHDGKNIKFTDITSTVRTTFNIGAPISYYVPRYAANMVKKSYSKDTFDLAELNLVPNGIEHDASFLRRAKHYIASSHIMQLY